MIPNETPWSSDQPLRADATDEQLHCREQWYGTQPGAFCSAAKVAREYAAACVQKNTEDITKLRAHLAGVREERAVGAQAGTPVSRAGGRTAPAPEWTPMSDITPTFPEPSLADAIMRLRQVQMGWNNTHSRRETNTWEAFNVVIAAGSSRDRSGAPSLEQQAAVAQTGTPAPSTSPCQCATHRTARECTSACRCACNADFVRVERWECRIGCGLLITEDAIAQHDCSAALRAQSGTPA